MVWHQGVSFAFAKHFGKLVVRRRNSREVDSFRMNGSGTEFASTEGGAQAVSYGTLELAGLCESGGTDDLDGWGLAVGCAWCVGGRIAYWRSMVWKCFGRARGSWTGVLGCSECDTTRYPVNQWIVAGEPV